MKLDELAFFNQQLAGMLKAGLPLEGSLKQLAAGMQQGRFRTEIEALEQKLAAGVPLERAVDETGLPEFYRRMLAAGRTTESLPQVLVLLADYYQQAAMLGARLRSVLVYPGIVIVGTWLLSAMIWWIYFLLRDHLTILFGESITGRPPSLVLGMLMPSIVITLLAIAYLVVTLLPGFRRAMMWRVPGLHDASLARLAHLFGMMLQSGCSLKDTLPVLRQLEKGSPVQRVVDEWERSLTGGADDFTKLSSTHGVVPPLFYWLAGSNPDDWSEGLRRASDIYYHRARNKMDLIISAALPVCVIILGLLILYQSYALYTGLLAGFLDMFIAF